MNLLIRFFGPGSWRQPPPDYPVNGMTAMPAEPPPDDDGNDSKWLARDMRTGEMRDIRKGLPFLRSRTREDRAHWEAL